MDEYEVRLNLMVRHRPFGHRWMHTREPLNRRNKNKKRNEKKKEKTNCTKNSARKWNETIMRTFYLFNCFSPFYASDTNSDNILLSRRRRPTTISLSLIGAVIFSLNGRTIKVYFTFRFTCLPVLLFLYFCFCAYRMRQRREKIAFFTISFTFTNQNEMTEDDGSDDDDEDEEETKTMEYVKVDLNGECNEMNDIECIVG